MKSSIHNDQETAQRADVLLAKAYPDYSRAALAKLFDHGDITQDGKPLKPGEKLQPGEVFEANIEKLERVVEQIDLPILYEDKNVIVIDKPVGVISHARGRYWDEASVASFVRDKVAGMDGERAGVVHRLDRATSGVMICAKNSETLSMLQKQFSTRKTKKSYYAVVEGVPEPPKAVIDVPIGRNPNKPQTFRPDPQGKVATTYYEIESHNDTFSLLKLTPTTGRTHQLRIHLQYIKHPIVGDTLYGDTESDRLYLHAYSLEITIPGGERKVFISQLPDSFNTMVA
jgi:23S rRNA pseudouridine1911/1915/1917 synthase